MDWAIAELVIPLLYAIFAACFKACASMKKDDKTKTNYPYKQVQNNTTSQHMYD